MSLLRDAGVPTPKFDLATTAAENGGRVRGDLGHPRRVIIRRSA